ncbi:UBP-type zinc finger domain-containing protein [Streptomyces gelaticus]|uniref:UBP-type zinc finger domain-containing protein n=1 Tax=Streptomyces gelaticus TaxID=285446 RepID=UPI0037A8A5C4
MTDIDGIAASVPPSSTGCADCDAVGGWWFHLRRCAQCGHIGCCDSSPAQHATAHWKSSGHPVVQSFERGEEWYWNYATDVLYESGPELAPPTSHPAAQPTPGPTDRVPQNWPDLLHP